MMVSAWDVVVVVVVDDGAAYQVGCHDSDGGQPPRIQRTFQTLLLKVMKRGVEEARDLKTGLKWAIQVVKQRKSGLVCACLVSFRRLKRVLRAEWEANGRHPHSTARPEEHLLFRATAIGACVLHEQVRRPVSWALFLLVCSIFTDLSGNKRPIQAPKSTLLFVMLARTSQSPSSSSSS
jgi:hypothetical protein